MKKLSDKAKTFSDLYSDYYSMVYNIIFVKIRDIDTTSDLAQEIFTRLYGKIDEIENPRQWLLSASKWAVVQHYEKNKSDNMNIDEVLDDENVRYVNGFRDTRIIIQEALSASENYRDEKDRIIYDLILMKNYTYAETAQQTGLSVRQVRYRYESVAERITGYLRNKGIRSLEELL